MAFWPGLAKWAKPPWPLGPWPKEAGDLIPMALGGGAGQNPTRGVGVAARATQQGEGLV
jgi:hypothetical protein